MEQQTSNITGSFISSQEWTRLVHLCATLTGDKDIAEDLAQETVQAMLRRGTKLQDITISAVAKESHVSVATIYRRDDLFALVQHANPTIQMRQTEQFYQKNIRQLQEALEKARADAEYYQKEAQIAKLGERRPGQEVTQLKKRSSYCRDMSPC